MTTTTAPAELAELKKHLQEMTDLGNVTALLHWDQSTYMPPGGAAARSRQLSLMGRLAHEKSTAPEVGLLLDKLRDYEASLDYGSDEASLIRVARREFDRATKIPVDLMADIYAHTGETYTVWTKARPANDFEAVRPLLERGLDYSRRLADCFPGYDHIADPLIDMSDYGMKAESIRAIFGELRQALVPLVQAITEQKLAENNFIHQSFPVEKQRAFGEKIIKDFGYDFQRGRQDTTHHPFMTKFSLGDVRITTRFNEQDLGDGLFSTLHESGHAMYEQGINMAYEATPLGGGTSAGVHESQSRLWENIVGRSLGFWSHYYPSLQATFPEQLNDVPLEAFHKAINKVQPSLIRVDADEVTYNLHVMIRFDLELALLEGSLAIKDLPEAWHARYEQDLGLHAPDDRDGVLQDVHWYGGLIGGAFQGYTLGNILSGQFYAEALKAHPEIPAEVENGQFETLHSWLKTNIYQSGSKFTAPELIEQVTGQGLTIEPYMAYLKEKYATLYKL